MQYITILKPLLSQMLSLSSLVADVIDILQFLNQQRWTFAIPYGCTMQLQQQALDEEVVRILAQPVML